MLEIKFIYIKLILIYNNIILYNLLYNIKLMWRIKQNIYENNFMYYEM